MNCIGEVTTEIIINATKLVAGRISSEFCKPENPFLVCSVREKNSVTFSQKVKKKPVSKTKNIARMFYWNLLNRSAKE